MAWLSGRRVGDHPSVSSPPAVADAPEVSPPGPRDEDDGWLIDRYVQHEDRAAFGRLVSRHHAHVFRVVLSVLGPEATGEAPDIVQDVFIRVGDALGGFRREGSFRAWIARLAANMAHDRRRRARWRKPHVSEETLERLPTNASTDDPHASLADAERARQIRRCLDTLPTLVRSVLHLHYWLDQSVDEIATALGLPAGTVKSHLHRGRRLLHRAMVARGLEP